MAPRYNFDWPVGARKSQIARMTAATTYVDACAIDQCPALFAVRGGSDDQEEPKPKLVGTDNRMQDHILNPRIGEHPGINGQHLDLDISLETSDRSLRTPTSGPF